MNGGPKLIILSPNCLEGAVSPLSLSLSLLSQLYSIHSPPRRPCCIPISGGQTVAMLGGLLLFLRVASGLIRKKEAAHTHKELSLSEDRGRRLPLSPLSSPLKTAPAVTTAAASNNLNSFLGRRRTQEGPSACDTKD